MNPRSQLPHWTDMNKMRTVGKASFVFANDHREMLPGSDAKTIFEVARLLAREAGLNDASIWFSESDRATGDTGSGLTTVLDHSRTSLHPLFATQEVFAFDFATGLTTMMISATPLAWTRGLREDGTWDEQGVYGSTGGCILFLGGNVASYRDLRTDGGQLLRPDGSRTSNILEALPPEARVVGSGPATLNGLTGAQ